MKLTAIVTTYNEMAHLEGVLECLRFADEILVVDSFSTDGTAQRASELGARVLQRAYDYPAAQKNWAIAEATHDWVLILDADERVNDDLKKEIETILSGKPAFEAYWIYRSNFFMGKRIKYSGWQGDKVLRLFARSACLYKDVMVHEEIDLKIPAGKLKNKLEHYTYKNLSHWIDKHQRYASWGAHDKFKKGKKAGWFALLVKPAFAFFRDFFLRLGFLDGVVGLVVCSLSAHYVFYRSLKLWRLQQGEEV